MVAWLAEKTVWSTVECLVVVMDVNSVVVLDQTMVDY